MNQNTSKSIIRHSVFETNSSSCHSLAWVKDNQSLKTPCPILLDDEQKSYVELCLPATLYRRCMAFRTTQEKLAYAIAVEQDRTRLSRILKDFFDFHLTNYLVLKKEYLEKQFVIQKDSDYLHQANLIVDTFNNREGNNVLSDQLVEHIPSGRLFCYYDYGTIADGNSSLLDELEANEVGQFNILSENDTIHDIIYSAKFVIHTGNDEADFPYSLAGLDNVKKELLLRIVDTLLVIMSNKMLPKFITDDYCQTYYLPKKYNKVVRAKLLGLKHQILFGKHFNYTRLLRRLAHVICLSDSKSNGSRYLLTSKNRKFDEWIGYPQTRRELAAYGRLNYLFRITLSDILSDDENELLEQVIEDFVTGLLAYCYTIHVEYTDLVNENWNLTHAHQQLVDLLKEKLNQYPNQFNGLRDKYDELVQEQLVVFLHDDLIPQN